MTYATNQAFTPMVNALGNGPTFYFFAVVCVLSFAWIYVYLFETKGRTLEEIQDLLKGGSGGAQAGKADGGEAAPAAGVSIKSIARANK
jgi:hypothetical protein